MSTKRKILAILLAAVMLFSAIPAFVLGVLAADEPEPLNTTIDCPKCHGTGKIDCDTCDENRKVTCPVCNNVEGVKETCDNCGHTGLVDCTVCDAERKVDCDNCGGTKKVAVAKDTDAFKFSDNTKQTAPYAESIDIRALTGASDNVTYMVSDESIATVNGTKLDVKKVGTVDVYAIDNEKALYDAYRLEITKADVEIVVKEADKTIPYGGGDNNDLRFFALPELKCGDDLVTAKNSDFTMETDSEYVDGFSINNATGKWVVKYKNIPEDGATVKIKWTFKGTDKYNAVTDPVEVEYKIVVGESAKDISAWVDGSDYNSETGWYNAKSVKVEIPTEETDINGISTSFPAKRSDVRSMKTSVSFSEGEYTDVPLYVRTGDGDSTVVEKTTKTISLKVDGTAPTSLALKVTDADGNEKTAQTVESKDFRFLNDNDTIVLSATDNLSGVAYFAIEGVDSYKITSKNTDGDFTITAGELRSALGKTKDINMDENTHVMFYAVDKAGNRSADIDESGNVWIVDNTAPEWAKVTLPEGHKNDATGKYYYGNADLNTTKSFNVEVVEENFFAEDAHANIYNESGSPANTDAQRVLNDKTFTFTLNNLADGKYSVLASYNPNGNDNEASSDRSGNVQQTEENEETKEPARYQSPSIIIDKTAPVISDIAFENDDEAADYAIANYYSAAQKVVLNISETNFDPEAVTVTVKKDGNDFTSSYKTTDWTDNNNGTYTNKSIVLSESGRYDISVSCTDLAGNKQAEEKNAIATIDVDAPEITDVTYNSDFVSAVLETITFGIFKSGDKEVEIAVKDETTSISEVAVTALTIKGEKAEDKTFTFDTEGTDQTVTYTLPENFRGRISVKVTDKVGNYTVYTYVYLDKDNGYQFESSEIVVNGNSTTNDAGNKGGIITDNTAPVLNATITAPDMVLPADLSGDDKTDAEKAKYANIIDFNNFGGLITDLLLYKGNVTVALEITEANFDASEKLDQLPTVKVDGEEKSVEWVDKGADKYSAAIDFEDDGRHSVEVTYTDPSGNEMVSYKTPDFIIDTTAPVITKFEIDTAGTYYYEDDKNGEVPEDNEVPAKADNKYSFYFQEEATVTVYANDDVKNTGAVSGVKDIILVSNDVEKGWALVEVVNSVEHDDGTGNDVSKTFRIPKNFKGNIYAVTIDRLGHFPVATVDYNDYKNGEFGIKQSAITGIDSASLIDGGNDAYYVVPERTIISDSTNHLERSHIDITVNSKTKFTERTEFSNFKEASRVTKTGKVDDAVLETEKRDFTLTNNGDFTNIPLFKNDVEVTISVEESYAGIRRVDYYVLGRKDQDSKSDTEGYIEFNNNGTKNDNGDWTVTKEKDYNIYTKATKNITVKNNSNDIVILVVMEDRAGNKSYDYNVIGIDKTKPEIAITYKDKQASGASEQYFQSRTATITVTERNFDPALVVYNLVSKLDFGGKAPNLSNMKTDGWIESGTKTVGGEKTKSYVYTIKYTVDGNYKFDMNVTDNAGNYSEIDEAKFYIDTTKPTIKVSLSNSDVKNGKYFKADRTATITITDKNFGNYTNNAGRFKNNIQATLNGAAIAVPDVSAFKNTGGDNWVATVNFTADGDYVLAFWASDDAGLTCEANASNEKTVFEGVSPRDFTVDKTVPTFEVHTTDGKDRDVRTYPAVPEITASIIKENNCDTIVATVSDYIFAGNGKGGSMTASAGADHVTKLALNGFKVDDGDGFYTVTVVVEDKAGNKDQKEISYVKNEFGAVYIGSNELNGINGTYTQSDEVAGSKDFFVLEFSPVELSDDNVVYKLERNGRAVSGGLIRKALKIDELKALSKNLPEGLTDRAGLDNWFVYIYTIAFNETDALLDNGDYAVSIISDIEINGTKIVNNNNDGKEFKGRPDDSKIHVTSVSYTIDDIVPVVTLEGFDKHTSNFVNEDEFVAKIKVDEDHPEYIFAKVTKYENKGLFRDGSAVTEYYLWVEDKDVLTDEFWEEFASAHSGATKDNVTVFNYGSEDGYKAVADLKEILWPKDSSVSFDIEIEVKDSAGNFGTYADRTTFFTDVSSDLSDYIEVTETGITFKKVTISTGFSLAAMIEDHPTGAALTGAGIAVVIAAAIFIPIFVKKRRKEDAEEAALEE